MNRSSLIQYLKERIREAIIAAGRAEFMARGFAGASMREIAGRAGIAVGNVYRYFAGKSALFEQIVAPAHRSLLRLVRADRKLDDRAIVDFRSVEPVADLLLEACHAYRTELLLLFDHSAGTRYGSIRAEVEKHIEGRLVQGLRRRPADRGDEDSLVLRVMAATFIEGFLMILRERSGQGARNASEYRGRTDRAVRRLLALFFKDIALRMACVGRARIPRGGTR